MADYLNYFQTWPIIGRAALLMIILWLVWCLLGKYIIKMTAIVPYVLRLALRALYWLLDFPLGILHSRFTGIFISLDRGWTKAFHSIDKGITKVVLFLWKNKKYFRAEALLIGIILAAIITLPGYFGLVNITREPEHIYLRAETWIIDNLPLQQSVPAEKVVE